MWAQWREVELETQEQWCEKTLISPGTVVGSWPMLLLREMLMFESYVEMATSITWTLSESWLLGHDSRRLNLLLPNYNTLRAGPAHCKSCRFADPKYMSMKTWPFHSSPVLWCGWGRDPLPPPCPSPPVPGERPGLKVIRAGEQFFPFTYITMRESGSSTPPGSTKELSLDVGVSGDWTEGLGFSIGGTALVCCAVDHTRERHPSPLPCPSPSMVSGRACTRFMRMGESGMPHTVSNTWESRPYTSPGQQDRAGHSWGGYRWVVLPTRELVNWNDD